MPNHVQNHIKVSGDPQRVQEFLQKVQNDEYGIGTLDFQKIISMPEDESDPYHWHIDHWGTKWNAYDYREGEDYSQSETLDFLTAWSAPHPILERLSEMFRELTVVHEWADEDLGVNCGRYSYEDGERTEEYEPKMVGNRWNLRVSYGTARHRIWAMCSMKIHSPITMRKQQKNNDPVQRKEGTYAQEP